MSGITLPDGTRRTELREAYDKAAPYKHTVVPGLLSDELVSDQVMKANSSLKLLFKRPRLMATEERRGHYLGGAGSRRRPTSIRQGQCQAFANLQIQQTPDLASLDPEHLPEETLAALPELHRLKDALYSPEFRSFVQDVTGCGPLSGKKKDASVGLYTEGSHLLLHDDSISTRVISYILYLPNSPLDAPESEFVKPADNGKFLKGWDPKWGGSLELFAVESGEERGLPGTKATVSLPVQWGQIIFFQVQPGRSYHSVEEVIVGDGRRRLGVSGWFHRPVEGEDGFGAYAHEQTHQAALSSLAQITSAPTLPIVPYTDDPPAGLTPAHISALKPFLAPAYLTPSTLEKLAGQFVAASEIVLHNFLHPDLAARIKSETEKADKETYGGSKLIPPQDAGEGDGWALQGPASKHRYASLRSQSTSTPTLNEVLTGLLPSEAFRAWLSVVSSLAATGYRAEARRFRRGLDYTLAAGEDREGDVRLDAYLGFTWWADVEPGSDEEEKLFEHGGWECYLPAPDASEDPETYQSALAKRAQAVEEQDNATDKEDNKKPVEDVKKAEFSGPEEPTLAASNGKSLDEKKADVSISMGGVELEFDPDQFSDGDFDTDSEADDGPLLTHPVGFNKLMLVLRDPGVMRFVKYLSAAAPGSRWDAGGEWEVGMLEEEGDEEEPEA